MVKTKKEIKSDNQFEESLLEIKKINPKIAQKVRKLMVELKESGVSERFIIEFLNPHNKSLKYEEILLKTVNQKIGLKVEKLKINKGFNKDIKSLRKKWADLIKKVKTSKDEQIKFADKRAFIDELFSLAKKYKLYPLDFWEEILHFKVIYDWFTNPFIFSTKKIIDEDKDINIKEIKLEPLPISTDANFELGIITDSLSNEKRLAILPFDDCGVSDIKKCWKYISDALKDLRKFKGIKKRFYPLKNLEIFKKIIKSKKKTDWEIADDVFDFIGEADTRDRIATNKDKEIGLKETKRKNKIKQIRYRYKNM